MRSDTYQVGPRSERHKTNRPSVSATLPSGPIVIADKALAARESPRLKRVRCVFLKLRPIELITVAAEEIASVRSLKGRTEAGRGRAWRCRPRARRSQDAKRVSEAAKASAPHGNLIDLRTQGLEQVIQTVNNSVQTSQDGETEPHPATWIMSAPDGFSWIERPIVAAMAQPASLEDYQWMREQGIQYIVCLTESPPRRNWINDAGLFSMHVPIEDMTAPNQEQIDQCITGIEKAIANKLGVSIHCGAGLGRTGTIVACW